MTIIETVLAWIGLFVAASIPVAIASWLWWRTWLTIRDTYHITLGNFKNKNRRAV